MPLNKSVGNMYPWATHTHSHLRGACLHACPYCYVQKGRAAKHYQGPLRIAEKEFYVNYGEGKTIFLEHCNDLFAGEVPQDWQVRILAHANLWPYNKYILQSKNPEIMHRVLTWSRMIPEIMVGTTIETNRGTPGNAPRAEHRYVWMKVLRAENRKTFITIEPIMDFDLDPFAGDLIDIHPDFINIGADSKGCGLIEPGKAKLLALINRLRNAGIEVREKDNLARLMR